MGEMLERSVRRKPSSWLSISAASFAPSFCIEEVAKHGNAFACVRSHYCVAPDVRVLS